MVIATVIYLASEKEVSQALFNQRKKKCFSVIFCVVLLSVYTANRKAGHVSYRIKWCYICWQRKFQILLYSSWGFCLWVRAPVRFLGTLWGFGMEQTDSLRFPAHHLDKNIYRSARWARDLALIYYAGETLLSWRNELLSIQLVCNSSIYKLVCWQQPS